MVYRSRTVDSRRACRRRRQAVLPALILLGFSSCATAQQPGPPLPHPDSLDLSQYTGDMPDYYGVITDHRDGDTFEIDWYTEIGEGVRLKGLDTPETGGGRTEQQYWGPEASAYAREHLPVGTLVRLDFDGEITDPFGRLLAYVWYWDDEQWVFWNRELLEAGMAYVYKDYPFEQPLAFLEYQAAAIAAGRGMWATPELIENDVVLSSEELAERKKWFREWPAAQE